MTLLHLNQETAFKYFFFPPCQTKIMFYTLDVVLCALETKAKPAKAGDLPAKAGGPAKPNTKVIRRRRGKVKGPSGTA